MRIKRETRELSTVALLSVAIALAGCAAQRIYKEPAGTAVASIEFVNDSSEPMFIFLHGDSKECTNRLQAGAVGAKAQRTVRIPADQDIVFTTVARVDVIDPRAAALGGALGGVLGMATSKSCVQTLDFLPEVGRTYVVRMIWDGKDCGVQFLARPPANQPSNEVLPVAFTKRDRILAWNESGPFCKKK